MKFADYNFMEKLNGAALKAFINDHCKKHRVRLKRGFFKVEKPMHVFKKLFTKTGTRVIANLIIPAGALIYCDHDAFNGYSCINWRKMRASEAFVHSLVKQLNHESVSEAVSWHDKKFKYHPGKSVKPTMHFSMEEYQCDFGIHFFVNLADAAAWM